ncbi:tyrosine recombinase XerC [Virgibacillus senegalensis]|uniref:tyrosine recombinase XerC n=1 Tax=Virgibacillus senegalensis TaxID=1499679 RepID=UPI00069CC309|nr:tyrosine recombinase XerC [Virgibacillus senegalensis]
MINWNDAKKAFTEYLQIEKNASEYTIDYYQSDIENFFGFLKQQAIDQLELVDHQVVRTYLTTLYEKKLSRRSVSRKISSLRSFYKFLDRETYVEVNPFTQVTLPKTDQPVPGFLYAEELERLFEVSDLTTETGQRNQAILELIYATGIRVSECTGLKLEDIDFDIGTLLVRGKGRKERYLPFGRFAEAAMQNYINNGREKLLQKTANPSSAVFLNARGNPLTARGLRLILEKMVKDAALTVHLHPHKLRHTFATHLLNEGADLRVVQELLGHEHLSSTQIYTHVTKDHLRKIYMNSHPRAKHKND